MIDASYLKSNGVFLALRPAGEDFYAKRFLLYIKRYCNAILTIVCCAQYNAIEVMT